MKILVVDDNPTTRELLAENFRPEGHAVLEAGDGVQALKILRQELVDAIVSDVLMPRMDGYRLCDEVRADAKLKRIPFVFYAAAYAARGDENYGLSLGADKFVSKSQPPALILEALREIGKKTRAKPNAARLDPPRESLMKQYSEKLIARLEDVNTELASRNEELVLKSTALETTANGVVITDAKGAILWVNPAFTSLTGYSADEAIGQNPRLLKSGRHGPEYYRNLWSTILDGKTWRGNFTNRRKDGTLYYDEHTITPVRDNDGRITHFVAIMNDVTERRRSEALLREREEQLRLYVEHSPAAIAMFDSDMKYLVASRRWMEDYRLGEQPLTGRSHYDVFPNLPPHWRELHCRCLAGAVEKSDEEPFLRADGKTDWIRWEVRPWRRADSSIGGIIIFSENITPHREAMEALRESEGKFRQLAENITDVFWIASPDLEKILYVSPGYERIWGRPAEEIYGDAHQWSAAILPEDRERALAVFGSLRRGEANVSVEYRIARPDGSVRWVHDRGFQVRDASGRVERLIGIAADVTGRKQAEASALRLAAIVEFSDDAIIGKSLDGIVTSWNPGAEKIFGYTAGEMVGQSILRLFPPDRVEEEREIMNRIGRGESVDHFETVRVCKDGRQIDISVTISPITDATGKIVGASKIARDITSQKRAVLALAESEELNRGVLNSVNAHIAVLDRTGRIIAVNEAWTRFARENSEPGHGLPARTEPGTNYLDVCRASHGEGSAEAAPTLEGLEAVLRGERDNFTIEYPCDRPGHKRWFLLNATPLRTKAGGAVIAHLDITQRREAEEQLRWRTALFEAQVHSAPDGILVVDGESHKILQNERMSEMWNIPMDMADEPADERQLEWATRQVKHPEQFTHKVHHLFTHPDAISRDEIELLDGRFFDRYSAPVRGRDGTYYGRIWSFRDITERKHTAEKIAEQADFLDKARDAIIVRDPAGKVIFWNQGAERIYGWTRQEIINRHVGEILYPDAQKFEELNDLTLRNGEWHGEIRHRTKDRRELIIEARWTLVRDNEGRPKSVVAINTDVTEKKKIEAQFMRAQRMESIGTLAGGVAHDLNNILAPIMLSIDVLKTRANDPMTREILDTIEVSAKRGSDIVRQVLSFARGLEGERVEIQPKHLIRDLEKIIKDTFPKDIGLHFSVPTDIWTILGDPTQVHQILLNLCVNARDAMPNGGKLTISVENRVLDEQYASMNIQAKPGRYVLISVTDTGMGIPPELLDKIFEPFFTTKALNKGTGLGLSTVMAIVKSHEGVINVYSEPGRGTTFKIYLPATELTDEARREQTEQASLPRGDGETVLVIDDEASVLTITGQTLQAFGYRVLTAIDGAEGVALYVRHEKEIAVVLTDMMMPVMDGHATIRALVRINPSVRIMAASGLATNANVTQSSGANVKHFLTKPYTAGALLKTIRAILDEPVSI